MDRRPIQARISATPEQEGQTPGVSPETFRDALSHWASGVTVVAARDETRVLATTVSAFASVSAEPPLVLVSLGANAVVLPLLEVGEPYGISLLSAEQRKLATVFADTLPVGAPDFAGGDMPVLPDALVGLGCVVDSIVEAGDHRLVIGRVERAAIGGSEAALVYYRRNYHLLEP